MPDPNTLEPPLPIVGDAKRYSHGGGNNDYRHPQAFFELFDARQRRRASFLNLAEAVWRVPQFIAGRPYSPFPLSS